MILLDTSVVVSRYREDHPHHGDVAPWLERTIAGDEQFAVPDVVWASFVRIVTNRRIFPIPSPTDDAFVFVRTLRSYPNHVAITPSDNHIAIFEDLCRRFDVAGDLVPDAYLASIAIDQGCSLASLDRDFARFAELDWVIPGPAS